MKNPFYEDAEDNAGLTGPALQLKAKRNKTKEYTEPHLSLTEQKAQAMNNSSTNHVPSRSGHSRAMLIDRQHLCSSAPHLEGMLQDLMAHLQERRITRPLCPAITVPTEYLQPVLEPHWEAAGIERRDLSTETLVLYLPSAFESVIGELATTTPTVFNHPSLDFRDVKTYLGWATTLASDKSTTELWVPERPLSEAICAAIRHDEPRTGWVPVVMCAGQSVAVGGFVVDDDLICSLQATCSCRGGVAPEVIYEPDEIREGHCLALEVGPTPWVYQFWSDADRGTFLAAEVYPCTLR